MRIPWRTVTAISKHTIANGMTRDRIPAPRRWLTPTRRLIWELYAAALKHEPSERAGYLERACTGSAPARARRVPARIARARLRQDTIPRRRIADADVSLGLTGRQIGNYVIQRELGRGGMGVVYLAQDVRLARTVAIKAMSPAYSHSPDVRQRLLNEAKMAAALSHPGIATVYALEEIDGELYLACEYVPGAPLRALVESGPLPIVDVIDIGLQLAKALAEAHTKGIVHRDIKPENVMKTPSGVIKVLDFGLARADYAMQTRLTQTGMLVGTPAYLAPEQALGQRHGLPNRYLRARTAALRTRVRHESVCGHRRFPPRSRASSTRSRHCCRRYSRRAFPSSIASFIAACRRIRPRAIARRRRSSATSNGCMRTRTCGRFRGQRCGGRPSRRAESATVAAVAGQSPRRHVGGVRRAALSRVVCARLAAVSLEQRLPARGRSRPPRRAPASGCICGSPRSTFPDQFAEQQASTARWTRLCDLAFAAVQVAAAVGVSGMHPEFAMLFVAASVAILIASLVIEPATVRAR